MLLMAVLCFGKQISSGYYRQRVLNSRGLVFAIMLLSFLLLRQMWKGESRRILIGNINIHVLYNPSRGDVKLGPIAIYKFLSSSQLNILSYDRGELSGQRSRHPAQVLSVQRAMKSPFHLMNRLFGSCLDRRRGKSCYWKCWVPFTCASFEACYLLRHSEGRSPWLELIAYSFVALLTGVRGSFAIDGVDDLQ